MDTEIIIKTKTLSKSRQLYINVRNKYKSLIARIGKYVFLKEQKEQQNLNKTKFNKLND